ncbi:class I SAM-dependent methyltransferase [Candidatus Woesearchaeota archaeon]|nr:class I SAM-dependent methyltransferase [Candidatus Woesearchaeota archaeon]
MENPELEELIKEQQELQKGTKSSSDLFNYDFDFGIINLQWPEAVRRGSNGLMNTIRWHIGKKGYVVWTDLGCGNGIALREAKKTLEKEGVDPGCLKTYGYDVLGFDTLDFVETFYSSKRRLDEDLINNKYKPEIKKADISTVELNERPDIITLHNVLLWVKDPLKVFDNVAQHMPYGSVVFMNSTANMMLKGIEDEGGLYINGEGESQDKNVFKQIISDNINIPGFDFVVPESPDIFHSGFKNRLGLVKKEEVPEFSKRYGLVERRPSWDRLTPNHGNGFYFYYTKK